MKVSKSRFEFLATNVVFPLAVSVVNALIFVVWLGGWLDAFGLPWETINQAGDQMTNVFAPVLFAVSATHLLASLAFDFIYEHRETRHAR